MPYLVASTHMWTSNSEGYGVMENGNFQGNKNFSYVLVGTVVLFKSFMCTC